MTVSRGGATLVEMAEEDPRIEPSPDSSGEDIPPEPSQRLRFRLGSTVGLLLLVTVALGALGIVGTRAAGDAYDGALAEATGEERAVRDLVDALDDRQSALRAYLVSGQTRFLDDLRDAREMAVRRLGEIRAVGIDAGDVPLHDLIAAREAALTRTERSLVSRAEPEAAVRALLPEEAAARAAIEQLRERERAEADEAARDARAATATITWIIASLLGVALCMGIYMLVRILRLAGGQERLVAALERLLKIDGVTGLLNHRAFQRRLREEVARAERAGDRVALVVLDLDHFREVNEALGHQEGDRALAEVARRLRMGARAEDVVGRTGGDELGWLMVETEADGATRAAERLRASISDRPVAGAGHLTASFGICSTDEAGSARELLRLTEGALYWAKSSGRDSVHRYTPETDRALSAEERVAMLETTRTFTTLRALARAVDAKDPSTREHSERVADLSFALARECGWTPERARLVREAALLHDVGKIGIPDRVLRKRGPLTSAEWSLIREHTILGARIVEGALSDEQTAWIRSHHERYDGQGYPDQLAGSTIPDGSRIIAVADAWDVMLSDRPYAPPTSEGEAMEQCWVNRGSQFDPQVVDVLAAALVTMSQPDADVVSSSPDVTPERRQSMSTR
jgi:diguanylate cyclase (GGDEF)-like protein/putative nucleotidyltransferase with HDIG domain